MAYQICVYVQIYIWHIAAHAYVYTMLLTFAGACAFSFTLSHAEPYSHIETLFVFISLCVIVCVGIDEGTFICISTSDVGWLYCHVFKIVLILTAARIHICIHHSKCACIYIYICRHMYPYICISRCSYSLCASHLAYGA